jgi:endonuclease/exonuclease/phosphatase family metal-dependent hydrolase
MRPHEPRNTGRSHLPGRGTGRAARRPMHRAALVVLGVGIVAATAGACGAEGANGGPAAPVADAGSEASPDSPPDPPPDAAPEAPADAMPDTAPDSEPDAPPSGSGGKLRVVSWNLQHASCPSCQAQKLKEQQPDLVLLQEAPSSAVETIAAELGAGWQSKDAYGVAMLTVLPLLGPAETRHIGPTRWSSDGRWAVHMTVDVGGVAVEAFGAHLDWYYDYFGDHVTSRNGFLAWIDEVGGRAIAGGDLNAWTWGAPEHIETIAAFDQRLTDMCSSLFGSHDVCNDMRTNFDTSGGSWRPDYIYRASSMESLSFEVVDRAGLSDHNLLVAEIRVLP